jgi:hypothetical protein
MVSKNTYDVQKNVHGFDETVHGVLRKMFTRLGENSS